MRMLRLGLWKRERKREEEGGGGGAGLADCNTLDREKFNPFIIDSKWLDYNLN